eukprot:3778995-Alexandrium_andersonii.AAC.1
MSASLVGSEMCIRDRANKREALVCTHRRRETVPGMTLANHLVLALRCTVSYTHLTLPTICSV